MDETREDSLTKHATSGIHDAACANHIRAGAKFVLAVGYEQREEKRKVKEKEAKEHTDKKRKHEHVTQKWDKDRDQKYKEEVVELQRGKRRAFHEDEPLSLLADLASKPSWQTILELKDPRDLPEDLVFSLMESGRPLMVVEDIRPIFRAYTPVGGHVCRTHQAEDYYRPTHGGAAGPGPCMRHPPAPPPPLPPPPPRVLKDSGAGAATSKCP